MRKREWTKFWQWPISLSTEYRTECIEDRAHKRVAGGSCQGEDQSAWRTSLVHVGAIDWTLSFFSFFFVGAAASASVKEPVEIACAVLLSDFKIFLVVLKSFVLSDNILWFLTLTIISCSLLSFFIEIKKLLSKIETANLVILYSFR